MEEEEVLRGEVGRGKKRVIGKLRKLGVWFETSSKGVVVLGRGWERG